MLTKIKLTYGCHANPTISAARNRCEDHHRGITLATFVQQSNTLVGQKNEQGKTSSIPTLPPSHSLPALQRTLRSPDFTHVTTGQSLWLHSWHCPAWVAPQLDLLDSNAPTFATPSHSSPRYKKQIILDFLQRVKSSTSPEQGRRLHAEASKLGIDAVIYVASSLVSMYAKLGCMEEARRVFDSIFHRDVILWTVLIMGYARDGQGDAAVRVFEEMMNSPAYGYPAAPPDGQTFVAALKACGSVLAKDQTRKMEVLEKVMALDSLAESSGVLQDMFISSSLVDLYARCGILRDARRVFDRMVNRSVVTWTVLMMGYVTSGESERALELFSWMLGEGCGVDSQVLVVAFKACSSLQERSNNKLVKLETGMALHREAERFACSGDVYVGSSLVDMYSKSGSVEDARRVFERMALRDVVSCTALLFGYAQNGRDSEALEMFSRMMNSAELSSPNAQSFVAALHACANLASAERAAEVEGKLVKVKSLETTFAIHREALRRGFDRDFYLSSALVEAYAKSGCMLLARNIFERAERQDDIGFTALMLGHAQNEEGELALELFFSRSGGSGWKPDPQAYVAALKACCSIGSVAFGKVIQAEICRNGAESDVHVGNSLVDLYTKSGSMAVAQHIFDSSPFASQEVVLWNSLITGYSRQGKAESVMEVFGRMEEEGVEPDGITSLAVLNACCHAGLVNEGETYFAAFRRKRGVVEMEHYHCMVDMLGRANQVEKAVEMMTSMPYEGDVYTWTIVLSACQRWRNVEMGKVAYEKLVSLDGKQGSSYVLMANMF